MANCYGYKDHQCPIHIYLKFTSYNYNTTNKDFVTKFKTPFKG